jgi:uncharacterized metal-binding protein YceD (DUF177 family)
LAVADIPPEGQQHHIAADGTTRAAVARLAGLAAIDRLEADLTAVPQGSDGVRVTGEVSATVEQVCVVTLEPMHAEVRETVDLLFLHNPPTPERPGDEEPGKVGDERVEALRDGTIDLGAVATEFLILGLDPYPRKPDAVFAAPPAETSLSSPFAALAALKKAPGEGGG